MKCIKNSQTQFSKSECAKFNTKRLLGRHLLDSTHPEVLLSYSAKFHTFPCNFSHHLNISNLTFPFLGMNIAILFLKICIILKIIIYKFFVTDKVSKKVKVKIVSGFNCDISYECSVKMKAKIEVLNMAILY